MRVQKSLQLLAYEHIKNLIITDEMKYDEIYSETKIAKELGISRTPMRDAMQCLSQEKYIDIIPNKGFCLHKMQMQDFIETYQIRTAIEGYCGRKLASEYATNEAKDTFLKLEKTLENQKKALDINNIQNFCDNDNDFHTILVYYIKNKELISLYESYIYRMRNFAMHSLNHEGRMESAYKEHLKVFKSMKNGKINEVYDDIMYHMESPKNISMDNIKEYYDENMVT